MGVIPLLTLLEKPIIILQLWSLYVFYPVLLSPILDYNDKNMERIMKRYLSGILRPLVSGKARK